MANFRYKVDDTDIILSNEEHERVNKAFEDGRSPVFLRGGKLALNKSFVRYVKETEQLTTLQEEENQKRLQLPLETDSGLKERRTEIQSYFTRTKTEFYKKMGWPHPKN